jgi:hypothetical protein
MPLLVSSTSLSSFPICIPIHNNKDGPNGAPSLVLLNPQVQLSLETQAQFLLQQPNSGNPIIRHPTPNIATKKEPKNFPQLDGGASSPQKNSPLYLVFLFYIICLLDAKQTANKEGIKKVRLELESNLTS